MTDASEILANVTCAEVRKCTVCFQTNAKCYPGRRGRTAPGARARGRAGAERAEEQEPADPGRFESRLVVIVTSEAFSSFLFMFLILVSFLFHYLLCSPCFPHLFFFLPQNGPARGASNRVE